MALTARHFTQEEFLHLLNQSPEVAMSAMKLTPKQLLSRLAAHYYIKPTIQHLNLLCALGREGRDIVKTTSQAPGFFPPEIVKYARRLVA